MRKALFLIAIVAICRLVPHPWHFVPVARARSLCRGLSSPPLGLDCPRRGHGAFRPGDRPCDRPPLS